jgi:hypothetical protein
MNHLTLSEWLAGDAVQIAPVSTQIPCKQGILKGILHFCGSETVFRNQVAPVLQALSIQFPGDLNREVFLGSGEFCARNREIEQKSRKR